MTIKPIEELVFASLLHIDFALSSHSLQPSFILPVLKSGMKQQKDQVCDLQFGHSIECLHTFVLLMSFNSSSLSSQFIYDTIICTAYKYNPKPYVYT